MNKEIWGLLVRAIHSVHDCPPWLKQQARLSLMEMLQLPQLEETSNEDDAIPSIDLQIVEADYLEFLREQIRIDARAPEWVKLLKARLTALEPFLHKNLVRASLHKKPHSATLYIKPETGELVHFEID